MASAHRQTNRLGKLRRTLKATTGLLVAMTVAGASAAAQTPLINGGSVSGSIVPAGDSDSFTFSANAGESVQLRAAEINTTSLDPHITVYNPNGAFVADSWGYDVGSIAFVPLMTGTYTVVVEDGGPSADQTGDYRVHYMRAPGANEHGALVNAGTVSGSITMGDLDTYTFAAAAGENIQLRAAEINTINLDPQITIYDPNGAFVSNGWGYHVGTLSFVPSLSGVYTLLVTDGGPSVSQAGDYEIHYMRVPGANENGSLVNAGTVSGSISMGDLDTYSFGVTAGENIELRAAEINTTELDPQITVYDPNGALVANAWGYEVGAISFVPSLTGAYTLLVSDGGPSLVQAGDYEIHYVRVPGANEHGSLINAGTVSGSITTGDLDTYNFAVTAGENIQLRAAEINTSALDPQITVYDPNGAFVANGWGYDVGAIAFVPSLSGTYTLLVTDGGPSIVQAGDYEVHYVRKPGANENGPLVNGGTVSGTISSGDLDTYTFDVSAGETVQLRAAEVNTTALDPQITVYDPNGAFVANGWGYDVGAITFVPNLTGNYTLLVTDGGPSLVQAGDYLIHYVRVPGANEHGLIGSGSLLNGTISMGDLDTFTIQVAAGSNVQLKVTEQGTTALDPQLTIYDPNGAFVINSWGYDQAEVDFLPLLTGTYTVLVTDGGPSITQAGSYGINYEGGAGNAFCFGDGSGTACPCGVTSNLGEGCTNSGGVSGAMLSATGTASLTQDSFKLHVSGVSGNRPGLILRGASQMNGGNGNVVGDGLLCVAGQTARSQVQVTSSGTTVFANFQGNGFGASSYGAGLPTNYQFWYRDPANTCSGSGFNFSNAWTVTWLP